jgi:hypothetical protein
MADFARWITACETAFWPAGTFLQIYRDNIAEAKEKLIAADLVGSAIRKFMTGIAKGWTKKKKEPYWEGTAHELLQELAANAQPEQTLAKIQQHTWDKVARISPGVAALCNKRHL